METQQPDERCGMTWGIVCVVLSTCVAFVGLWLLNP